MRGAFRRYWLGMVLLAAIVAIVTAWGVAEHADAVARAEQYQRTNFSLIEDGLNLGGMLMEPPPGTQAVLNVCETEDPYHAEFHQWDPIPDTPPAPSLAWLRLRVEFIDQQRKAGRTVFVHCRAGISRSGLVVAAYWMWREGGTRDEALEFLRSKRPIVYPNGAFMRLLSEWEASTAKAKS
jgi:hypothetical protein